MLRNWARLRRALPCFVTPRNGAQGTILPMGGPQRFSHKLQGNIPKHGRLTAEKDLTVHLVCPYTISRIFYLRMDLCLSQSWISPSGNSTDRAVPNPSWSQEMLVQFNRFMEKTKDGSWLKLPSYRSFSDHLPEGQQKEKLRNQNFRMFLRSIDQEGMGFEYAMFLKPSEKRVAAVFQMGPYLEGPSGFAHGGAIATILDSTVGASVIFISRRVVTANLNINYKSPVSLGSVILVDTRVDKIEGRKIFASGNVRSTDGQTLHAEATGLFIELQPPPSPQKETDPSSYP